MLAPFTTTLLDLVQAISSETTDDREVVATIAAMVNSGRVRLSGIFAGATITCSSPVRSRGVAARRYRDALRRGA